jgi:hypothetical protein
LAKMKYTISCTNLSGNILRCLEKQDSAEDLPKDVDSDRRNNAKTRIKIMNRRVALKHYYHLLWTGPSIPFPTFLLPIVSSIRPVTGLILAILISLRLLGSAATFPAFFPGVSVTLPSLALSTASSAGCDFEELCTVARVPHPILGTHRSLSWAICLFESRCAVAWRWFSMVCLAEKERVAPGYVWGIYFGFWWRVEKVKAKQKLFL